MALKREENEWKASAMERARKDLRAVPPDDLGAGGGNHSTATAAAEAGASSSSYSSSPFRGGGLQERVLERVAEEGPGADAMRAVGLVRVGGAGDSGAGGDPSWTPQILADLTRDGISLVFAVSPFFPFLRLSPVMCLRDSAGHTHRQVHGPPVGPFFI